ncbi:MAG TPA: Zn-ribbon domain-containing OB-fold protein [Deltaproteobacteria bacterium]|nr:Zn-ribbon domain-containing OB-fold protein [Deltaproteobacteria bacterium]
MEFKNLSEHPLPITPLVQIPESGDPYLQGFKCKSCGAITLKSRMACAKCGGRDTLEPFRLSTKGTLHAYSIIYRAFPGIDVPFVSAIADLEGGGTIKTNLIDVEPDPEKIQLGMDVDVVFQIAPRKDAEGNEYLAYFLKPAA